MAYFCNCITGLAGLLNAALVFISANNSIATVDSAQFADARIFLLIETGDGIHASISSSISIVDWLIWPSNRGQPIWERAVVKQPRTELL